MAGPGHNVWSFVLRLAATPVAPPWVLVGGLMVQLHALEHGLANMRPTRDADLLVDVITVPRAIGVMCDLLVGMGLSFEGADPDGIGHRFSRGDGDDRISVDVLAPDHLGPRTATTTISPARTVQIPAGRRILKDAEIVAVRYDGQQAVLRRPSLVSAIIGKARAWDVDSSPARERHLEDAAVLLVLVSDPVAVAESLDRKQRATMRALASLLPATHPTWRRLANKAPDGIAALELLSDRH